MDRSFEETIARYRRLQRTALLIATHTAERSGNLTTSAELRLYDAAAEDAWTETWRSRQHPSGSGGWNWPSIVRSRWRRPSALRAALWSGRTLCGLALAHPSRRAASGRRRTVTVDLLEGAPFVHPLRGAVAPILLSAAVVYCRQLGGSRVCLREPASGMIERYAEFGFVAVRHRGRVTHCEREV